jgi:hypothetical protein
MARAMNETRAYVLVPIWRQGGAICGFTKVDAVDAQWMQRWRWYLNRGYVIRGGTEYGYSGTVKLAREILGLVRSDSRHADHLNHDKLDNRRANLRAVSQQVNQQNVLSKPGSSSQYRGVTWDKGAGKWAAFAQVGGRMHNLGRYESELRAGEVAEAFRRQHMPGALPDPALAGAA